MTNRFTLHLGDCLESMRGMADCSVDAICTDPPYGLSFMGKRWDYDVPGVDVWTECLRVLKPGGHLLAFSGTRTQHRMAVRIEDAGFEIRDMIAWVYGSGFPKSLDVSKAIDKAAGVEFDAKPAGGVGFMNADGEGGYNVTKNQLVRKGDSTEAARQWQGWGTALKPALEPITVARKPLGSTVAECVLAHGTGAINVDGCRVDAIDGRPLIESKSETSLNAFGNGLNGSRCAGVTTQGRWPANLIHDGSEEVLAGFPESKGQQGDVRGTEPSGVTNGIYGEFAGRVASPSRKDSGSAARFFKQVSPEPEDLEAARLYYCAKAGKRDRDAGLEGFQKHDIYTEANPQPNRDNMVQSQRANVHPTVKPTDLMAYLVRLVTPPGGVVLDPFMGSGSTGKAAMREGFRFIGCEMSEEYMAIARARIEHEAAAVDARHAQAQAAVQQPDLFA